MNYRILLSFCCLYITCTVFAQQTKRAVISPNLSVQKQATQVIPLEAQPFLAYFVTQAWQNTDEYQYFQIRFSESGNTWTAWQTLAEDAHLEAEEAKWASKLYYTNSKYHYYEYRWTGEATPQKLNLHFYSPDTTPEASANSPQLENRACACEQPAFQSRTDWCNNCPEDTTPATHDVSHLIIHHSAGTNVANDWAAIVRSIWDFHVNGREWDDVGYNWLIDPNGVLYAGRASDVRGAHFCGKNTGAEGVCVLGDFTEITPTDTTLQTLNALWAWKACDRDVAVQERNIHAASGRNLFTISGHRDGCATACPGDMFYPLLEQVRQSVADYQAENCMLVSTDEVLESAIQIYPNPVANYLNIRTADSWDANTQVAIHNISGQVIKRMQLNAEAATLDLSALQTGVYLLQIEQATKRAVFKILKL